MAPTEPSASAALRGEAVERRTYIPPFVVDGVALTPPIVGAPPDEVSQLCDLEDLAREFPGSVLLTESCVVMVWIPSVAPRMLDRAWSTASSPLAQLESGSSCKFISGALPPPRERVELIRRTSGKKPLPKSSMPSAAWRWNAEAERYIADRRSRGEWSEDSTVPAYRGHLRAVLPLLTGDGEGPPSVAGVTAVHIRRLREAPRSPNYVGLLLVVLRGFLEWAGNPVASEAHLFRISRTDLGRRRWLTREQAVALWNAADDRERIPIGLMLWAGLRRVEVLRLRVRDVDFALDNATMRVCGKGRKWRAVPVPPVLWAVLRERTTGMAPDDRVWPGGKNGVDRVLYAAGRRAGCFAIRPRGTPDLSNHDLRRTYIRLTLETGELDPWDVAPVVGHKSVDMTIHYAGLDRTKVVRAARALESMLGLRTPEA